MQIALFGRQLSAYYYQACAIQVRCSYIVYRNTTTFSSKLTPYCCYVLNLFVLEMEFSVGWFD